VNLVGRSRCALVEVLDGLLELLLLLVELFCFWSKIF